MGRKKQKRHCSCCGSRYHIIRTCTLYCRLCKTRVHGPHQCDQVTPLEMSEQVDADVETIGVSHVPTVTTISKPRKDHSIPNYSVTYEFSHKVNLDKVIEDELKRLSLGAVLKQAVEPLEKQVDALEATKSDIEKIFLDAFEQSERLSKQYEDEEKKLDRVLELRDSVHDTIVIDDDDVFEQSQADQDDAHAQTQEQTPEQEELVIADDDDVQIVDTTFEQPKHRTSQSVIAPQVAESKPSSAKSSIIRVNGPLDSAQLAKLADGQLIQMVNDDGKKIKTYRVRKVPFYQTQRRATLPGPMRGQKLFAMKKHEVWYGGILENINKVDAEIRYRVRFDGKGTRDVTGKELAWFNTQEKLPLGTRVIAPYFENTSIITYYAGITHYAGITAELPSTRNDYRYLIFFDDGYAQYNKVGDVKQVYNQNANVWEDVSEASRDFVKQYLEQYPERPMVRLQKNQIVKTEWNGKWWTARVQEVDASLVKMYFDADGRTEWIYRGSTRLAPLYTELANAEASKVLGRQRRHMLHKASSRQYVEYTRNHGDEPDVILCDGPKTDQLEKRTDPDGRSVSAQPVVRSEEKRPMARKSTSSRHRTSSPNQTSTVQAQHETGKDALAKRPVSSGRESLGWRVELNCDELKVRRNFVRYVVHECDRSCGAAFDSNMEQYRGRNPLTMPMYFGWERQIAEMRNKRPHVYYRGPCGRRLRNMAEVDKYLFKTDSAIPIDTFCFDPFIHPYTEFRPQKTYCDIKDLSYGKESVPISCVNNCDCKYPDYVEYSNQRLPAKGVTLNLDPDFLCGCDCEDDCRDRSKCACRQLTVEMTAATREAKREENAGYHYRRLDTPILTGIYECNPQCKCSSRCHNKVVQNGLAMRLQVFKTEKRGWGLRCLDDIPMGAFVCIYAGQLLTDQAANEDGNQYGDEYLAELDHIEMIAGLKEGYEEDVVDPGASDGDFQESDSPCSPDSGADSGLEMTHQPGSGTRRRSKRVRRKSDIRKSVQSAQTDEDYSPEMDKNKNATRSHADDSDDSDENRRPPMENISRLSKMPDPKSLQDRQTPGPDNSQGFINPRKYYGEESCYIMDAKSIGNIGRYLNHSCEPNMYVQNVFVDTHDLRFPWVAFFASENIRAGVELTWDYNYVIDSVEDKVLHCYCASAKCRGRLL